MSEARRAAKALVEKRVERFESRYGADESRARLEASLARARPEGRVAFTPTWVDLEGKVALDADFAPAPRTAKILNGLSIAITLLIAFTVWALVTGSAGEAGSWLLGLTTVLAILAMPWIFVGMGSSRLAEEARIVRAIRAALQDEDEKMPPARKWEDED